MASAGIGHRVEGVHAVAAALAAGRVTKLIVERGRLERVEYEELVGRATDGGVEIEVVDDVGFLASTDAPQGVVAKCRPLPVRSIEDAVAIADPPAVLVLDHVEDPRNVGAAARSALAAGVRALVVPERRSAPLSATAFKAAAGALEHVLVVEVSSVARAVDDLRRHGLWIVGLDADGDRPLFGLDLLTEPVAVVVGAEGEGLSRLVAEKCDVVAIIPMIGEAESLNASVAAALSVYEIARVRAWV